MGDRRGFRYELEPVQRKCDWDLNDVVLKLTDVNRSVSEQEQRVQKLTHEFSQVKEDWNSQLKTGQLNIDLQRITYGYLSQLQDRISQKQIHLKSLEQERDTVIQRSHELRKFADNLEKHRGDALREHERKLAEVAFKDADDTWLQRINWRKLK
jgi:chromosome segregation ATPase